MKRIVFHSGGTISAILPGNCKAPRHTAAYPIIALTATATREVKADIIDKLAFRQPIVFQKSFARENLSYSAFEEEDKEKKLYTILQNVPGSAVVYMRSRKRTQLIAEWLNKAGISADYYHAGLNNEQRSQRQDSWITNRTRVIVATNAFGMGIDKPDVRTVVHLICQIPWKQLPGSRQGRDEMKKKPMQLPSIIKAIWKISSKEGAGISTYRIYPQGVPGAGKLLPDRCRKRVFG
jgi:hypothetical protein